MHVAVRKPDCGKWDAGNDYQEKRRENSSRSPFIERYNTKSTLLQVGPYNAGNQVTANNKKDIDADEPAAERRESGVEKHYRDNGNGSQAVDFGAISHLISARVLA